MQGAHKKKTSKNHNTSKIKNLIEEDVLDIIDPGDQSRSDMENLNLFILDAGEESLLQAMVQRIKKHSKAQHIFVSNDQRALEIAHTLNLEIETITDYLNHLTDYQIIKCERALSVAEIALSKISKYRSR